jgi:hypothetical protein
MLGPGSACRASVAVSTIRPSFLVAIGNPPGYERQPSPVLSVPRETTYSRLTDPMPGDYPVATAGAHVPKPDTMVRAIRDVAGAATARQIDQQAANVRYSLISRRGGRSGIHSPIQPECSSLKSEMNRDHCEQHRERERTEHPHHLPFMVGHISSLRFCWQFLDFDPAQVGKISLGRCRKIVRSESLPITPDAICDTKPPAKAVGALKSTRSAPAALMDTPANRPSR